MNIGLCDDDHASLRSLARFVTQYGEHRQRTYTISSFDRGEDLLNAIEAGQDFEVLFLDIYMGTSDGISVAKKIREKGKTSAIVFATNSRDHAIDGYGVRAAHYLLKPLEEAAVWKALDLAMETMPERANPVFQIQNRQGTYLVPLAEILYVESNARVLTVHTCRQGDIVYYDRLDNLEQQLDDPRFLRCHKSFLVNLDLVRACVNNTFVMESGQSIRISIKLSEAKEKFAVHKASGL